MKVPLPSLLQAIMHAPGRPPTPTREERSKTPPMPRKQVPSWRRG